MNDLQKSDKKNNYINKILEKIATQLPFSSLDNTSFNDLFAESELFEYQPGQTILRPDELSKNIFLVINGKVRLLGRKADTKETFTLSLRGSGQLLGWVSLLRAAPTEWIIASTKSLLISIPANQFVQKFRQSSSFASQFLTLANQQESFAVADSLISNTLKKSPSDWDDLFALLDEAVVYSVLGDQDFLPTHGEAYRWFISSSFVPECSIGTEVIVGQKLPSNNSIKFPYRVLGLPLNKLSRTPQFSKSKSTVLDAVEPEDFSGSSLLQLGILEDDHLSDEQRFPVVHGQGSAQEALAVAEMVCLHQKTPFRRDILEKLLEDQFRRNKGLSIELVSRLCELMGLKCQIALIKTQYLGAVEGPTILFYEEVPIVIFHVTDQALVCAHPHRGIIKIMLEDIHLKFGNDIKIAVPRRTGSTPTSRFGWNWFTPLIGKYKKPLLLVFIASLLAQLFGLAVPLLIQQIIDKVLSQGNLSSLNVLGSAMVILALFQGILMALRTYIFVDTTDRMDLSLGSSVIDRLLSLPLSFFEKRPVGELSQRLGELNTIRGFLTGTALVSVLNIIFALLYLVVMVIYSPLLTAVSLSTLPLYFLIVFGVAPIYKNLLRKRAVAQARTQSHLIEVLGGIQTVKAQHFELTARWKWQDRYREFVNNGFKSAVLGSTSGEVGKFLNQFSGLLVLWVGMWLVLEGQLTLGMLIAFRIISGNVTGPLLQLSGLYQGFQKVQISMERLSDILDQNPELAREDDIDQIPLPPIQGNIRFEDVSFRFGAEGPFQVSNVNLSIKEGSFVGIVGQSGSGKSTLMKLLPRLYSPNSGRIFIDDYDIGKVNLSSLRRQIGIVPQDSLLFEGTIAENISLNDPQASTESIIEAAKIACAHEFIMSLGKGYATKLSEKGSNLSGGQRQRIAIARTILANPQLLVMDEATSALDYNTERQLCVNLQAWAKQRTVLFITHRLSSIRNSDLILVMNAGCLVEQGTHSQLMELGQRYNALYLQQGE